jgi:hypothetical protein
MLRSARWKPGPFSNEVVAAKVEVMGTDRVFDRVKSGED